MIERVVPFERREDEVVRLGLGGEMRTAVDLGFGFQVLYGGSQNCKKLRFSLNAPFCVYFILFF